jgi:lysophospholipase
VQQLFATPDNPPPESAVAFALTTGDGRSLRAARFFPKDRPRGTIALIQGRAEFIEKYFETVRDFLERGFAVATFDWRGQGGSERELANPRKGHIDDFTFYQRDLDAFIAQVLERYCPKPWFAVAHSMGGAILLEHTHSSDTPFQRVVVTAPMIEIAGVTFPAAARALADTLDMLGLGGMFIPGGKEASLCELPFKGNKLTSDYARFTRNASALHAAPQLAIGDPTVGWANAAFRQIARFAEPDYARRSRTPTLFISCGRDEIVSTRAGEAFAQRMLVALHMTIPGAKHELMMERDELRDQFFAALDAFLPGSGSTAA